MEALHSTITVHRTIWVRQTGTIAMRAASPLMRFVVGQLKGGNAAGLKSAYLEAWRITYLVPCRASYQNSRDLSSNVSLKTLLFSQGYPPTVLLYLT